MPAFLIERISASLAAEQSQRATSPGASVTPLLGTARRWPGRRLLSIAGAAAAVVLIGVLGNSLINSNQSLDVSASAGSAHTPGTGEVGGAAPSAGYKENDGSRSALAAIQIRLSAVRYTQADFVTQARVLHQTTFGSAQPKAADSSGLGAIGTPGGLSQCLSAIGAGDAQLAQADVAFYEGQPAVIIVATKDTLTTAYAVGRGCSLSDPELLHPAAALP